jgi:hypothetical protein
MSAVNDLVSVPPVCCGSSSNSVFWRAIFLKAAELSSRAWDAVVVDEAQDLEHEAWLLVSTISEEKRLWAFFDPGQASRPSAIRPARSSPPLAS